MVLTQQLLHPTRAVPLGFVAAIVVGTVLLTLPISKADGGGVPLVTALFTATSAVCVTGLTVVDTATYWSPFGLAMILLLCQIGGLGIMTGATLLGLIVGRRLPLARRLIARTETASLDLGDVAEVLKLVLGVTLLLEAITAAALTLRLALGYDMAWDAALWHGLFHAVSAFNQAGFSTWSDSLVGFQTDILVLGPVMAAVLVSGLGFPVLHELRRELRTPKSWSVHTKITLFGSGLLLAVGSVALTAYEWNNPATLGPMGAGPKLLNGLFHSVMPRSAGLNTIDVGQLRSESLVMNHFLMLVGGGSASTAGGIKVTTFFLLGYVVWAQVRGEPDVTAFGRRISSDVQREALTVVLLSISFVAAATLCLLSLTDFSLEDVLFETISAFATVGLSTGITSRLPPTGQVLLVALMFVGRVGTITVAAALAMRRRGRPFRYPEERPIVG